jgi:hypothetical protein
MKLHQPGGTKRFYLDPLPDPVHFVLLARSAAWPELLTGRGMPADADEVHERILENDDNWIVQTYLRLRNRGLDVTMSKKYRSDAINVISYHDLKARDWPTRFFTVAVRQDSARPCLADHRIVQNPLNIDSAKTDHMIPHWPQPGMIGRDISRGRRVENVCFKGAEANLYKEFQSEKFKADLAGLGARLVFDVKDKVTGRPPQWFDYRECDVILAVRDATVEDMKLKPASKLVNAWRAGCPAVLGPEPAFQQLRKSPLDYLEVSSPDEAIAAVRRLRDEPELYQAMVSNGFERGEPYSPDAIAQIWRDTLAGPVNAGFRRFRRMPVAGWPFRLMGFALRVMRDKNARKLVKVNRDHGYRPISGTTT